MLAMLPIIVVMAVVFGILLGVRGDRITILALAAVTFVVACVPLVVDLARPGERRHVFISLLGLIFMIHYAVPALVFYVPATGGVPAPAMSTEVWPPDAIRGQLVALVGLVSLLLGYASPAGRVASTFLPKPKYDWSADVTLMVACVFIGTSWLLNAAALAGLVPPWVGTGFVGVFAHYYFYANALLVVLILRDRSAAALLVLVPNLLLAVSYGVFTSRKSQMLVGPMIVLLTYMLWTGRVRLRWFAAGAAVIALVYPMSQFVRYELGGQTRTLELLTDPAKTIDAIGDFISSDKTSFAQGLEATGARLDGLGVTSVIVRDTPSVSDFQNGRTIWLFFVAFIPRGLWPGKPDITLGGWITAVYGPGPQIKSATGPTQIGDFYLNYGWWSVIGGMAILGAILRAAYETLFRQRTPMALLLQIVIVYHLVVRFEGGVGALWSSMIFALTPVIMAQLAVRLFFNLPVYSENDGERGSSGAAAGLPADRGSGSAPLGSRS